LIQQYNGNIGFFRDSGLTVGATYNPTVIFSANNTGVSTTGTYQVSGTQIKTTNLADTTTMTAWTPTVGGDSTAGTVVYNWQTGLYDVIGRHVHIQATVYTASITGAVGNLVMAGLPFPNNGAANNWVSCSIGSYNAITFVAGYTHLTARIPPGSTVIYPVENGSNQSGQYIPMTAVGSSMALNVACDYDS
jgi:hypothetical protein